MTPRNLSEDLYFKPSEEVVNLARTGPDESVPFHGFRVLLPETLCIVRNCAQLGCLDTYRHTVAIEMARALKIKLECNPCYAPGVCLKRVSAWRQPQCSGPGTE